MSGKRFTLEVQPQLPESLGRLDELANDLLYSWDHRVRGIFYRLDRALWQRCGHNPKLFLRRVAQEKLESAVTNRAYMEEYRRVVNGYDAYREARTRPELSELIDPNQDLVTYFCAEYGFHESFPIYSGGLGILAGDYCKAASDLGLPLVAVGLLYRQGYFTQVIDGQGRQQALYHLNDTEHLPIRRAEKDGQPAALVLEFPGRQVHVRIWEALAGHVRLLLLDTDTPENSDGDRSITYQLYGGDSERRIQQEIVLGVAGTRALRLLGYKPSAWHINEGHAAFQILERCRESVADGMDFDSALELVASGTLFTTHTPVPAGHDIFSYSLIETYLSHFTQSLGIDLSRLYALGQSAGAADGFNMTTLALHGSRFHNGVSRIHGGVASEMEHAIWPQIPPDENPIGYVTNGVHVPTFLAREWGSLFDMRFDTWQSALLDPEFWEQIDDIPDYQYWSVHKALKQQLIDAVKRRVTFQHRRNGTSHSVTARTLSLLNDDDQDFLILGFARRFATYKRATLMFSDTERLAALLNNPEKPCIIIYAGKAHPNDQPGQQLIRVIHELSLQPEFIGKIILLEGYDLAVARQLVSGVDVWLNTPEAPLEASGTSGQKAAVNGALNLSVLDGWWAEGFEGDNGWGIAPRDLRFDKDYRNREEAGDLLDILEHEVIPLFYARDGRGYSEQWVRLSKASMKSIMPRFNAQRMVMDYVRNYYDPAQKQMQRMSADNNRQAQMLAQWKAHIRHAWPEVRATLAAPLPCTIRYGEVLPLRVNVSLGALKPEDIIVEAVVEPMLDPETAAEVRHYALKPEPNATPQDAVTFALDLEPPYAGVQSLRLRLFPWHELLSHRFEVGLMIWIEENL